MEVGLILRLIVVLTGVSLLGVTVLSLAKRVMNESFCLAWEVVSAAIIVAGFALNPSECSNYISKIGMFLICLIFFTFIYAAYFTSIKISELMRKNQELAIQISLLNSENDRIMKRLSDLLDIDERDI